MDLKRKVAALAALALAVASLEACSGSGVLPNQSAPRARQASVTGTPADSPEGLPGDSPAGLPGDSPESLPGDSPEALPGGDLALCPDARPGVARCLAVQNTGVLPLSDPAATPLEIRGLHPADIRSAYGLPAGGGDGQTVAIVDAYDDPGAEADLAVYRNAFGLTPCTTLNGCFQKTAQDGSTRYPAPNAAWATEIALDLDVVSATCPRCRILLVEASSASLDDLAASDDRAVALGATVVSNSYDAAEWPGEAALETHYAHRGVPITVSSGDGGIPTYPAASRYVTAVGGTTLTRNGSGWTQSPWKNAGHGCSYYMWRPYWQPKGPCHNARSTVDIAVVADPQTGVAVYDDFSNSGQAGGWIVVGGTSVGAPLVASAYALAGNGRSINSAWYAYQHRDAFTDIGPAGFDAYAGIGSPRNVTGF
ncbi:MAG TPA: hypothetical protein VIG51_08505 [Candidatus Baltobacteraceae bacterium]